MSTKTISKIETRIVVGFDDETKAEIAALKGKLDEVARGLSAKKESHADGLLAAMQAEAANDAPESELLQLGQWVFEGEDDEWVSAAKNSDGCVYLHNITKDNMFFDNKNGVWLSDQTHYHKIKHIEGFFEPSALWGSYIARETVNDIDYLSTSLDESVPHIDEVLAQPNWLSESVPQITQADMQLIFIKNLSEVLIQRMHSMDRFSEDDYAIGGDKLEAWDIVFEPLTSTFGLFTGKHEYQKIGSFLFFTNPSKTVVDWDMATAAFTKTRTITESEMKDFREVLEACYA